MASDDVLWHFFAIRNLDPGRADDLTAVPSDDALASSILARFVDAMRLQDLRVGMEESSRCESDLRLALQFHVGERLSDQFFNATTGYRAQFRRHWRRGLEYNDMIVAKIRSELVLMPETFPGRRLDCNFNDRGPIAICREQARDSLVFGLSKLWFCSRLILGDGSVQDLPVGVSGPRLDMADGTSWPAIWRDEASSWVEVKGAFVGAAGPYQLKDPVERARKLASAGEA